MPSASEVREQVARESEQRRRFAVPAFASGILYLLSGIIVSASLSGTPTVGVIQGLAPALHGEANPRVSPRTPTVKFVSHHALTLIAGSVIAALALVAGMGTTMVASMRVGLTARWVSFLGIFAAVLFVLGGAFGRVLPEIVTAFWLVAMGILFIGKWPNGDPPAWASGEARPW